jgi:hypothetical protein
MTETIKNSRIGASLGVLRDSGIVPAVAQALSSDTRTIVRELRETVTTDVHAYTQSGNPDVLPELQQHLEDVVDGFCRLLAGNRARELEFVSAHADRRAEQKFPLDALLHTYRCAYLGLLPWIRDAAIAVASDTAHVRRVVAAVTEFTFEYTSAISTLTTSEYVDHTRLQAEAAGDRRTELLNLLLLGYDESDGRAAHLLRGAGYLEQRQSFCVAVARSVDPREMESAARAQRMADTIGQVLHDLPVRSLITVRDSLVTVVMSGSRRLSGWTAPQSLLADRVYPQLRKVGPAAVIGLSADAPSTSHIPRALSEAKIALDFANVADRVMPYAQIPFRKMLVRSASENVQSALPAWLDDLLLADKKARGTLIRTLHAYADADMNVLRTAKILSLHPNTIYARMQKIADITGKNALSYHALTELLLATDCAASG